MHTAIRFRGLRAIAASVLAAAVLVPASATAAGAAADGDTRELLQTGADDLHEWGVTGVQAMLRDGRHTTWVRAGVRDLRSGAPVPHNGYFRMGSNTKTFAAVIVLQLVAEGELSLADTVEQWLPGVVTGNGNDGSQITVRQLLQHTSGLYNYTNDVAALASADAFFADRFDTYEPEELVAIAMKHEPEFPPGEQWDYSNTNYILAGMIIEEVTGRSWSTEVYHRITRPLGLRQTYSPGAWPFLRRPHATGYHQFEPDGQLLDTTAFNPTVAYAAGDLVTTAADLTRFWQALFGGELLPTAQQAELESTVLAGTFQDIWPGARYGLGVMWLPDGCGGHWSHGGDVPGMSTVNGVTPDGDRAAVISLSTQFADDEQLIAVYQRSEALIEDSLCG